MSLGADLGLGQPMEHVLRECLIAMRLAERVGLDSKGRATACYTALPTWVGCPRFSPASSYHGATFRVLTPLRCMLPCYPPTAVQDTMPKPRSVAYANALGTMSSK